jgi:3-hydroxyacyl-CoA dehydrogenase
MTVAYAQQGAIAVLTVDNPPVNALSVAVRQGLIEGIKRAVADPAVAGIVLIGKGRTFIAGADIREFGKPPQAPRLTVAIAEIEASPKPVVASRSRSAATSASARRAPRSACPKSRSASCRGPAGSSACRV